MSASHALRVTALVAELDWLPLSRRLTAYAFIAIRKSSIALAQDLAQEAITQVLDRHYKAWDPDAEPDIFEHLCNLVGSLLSNRRRKHGIHRELVTPHDQLVQIAPAAADDPEATVALRQATAALGDRLGASFAEDGLVRQLIALTADGITTPREQTEATGASYDDVLNARKRLFRGAAEVARELGLRQEVGDAA